MTVTYFGVYSAAYFIREGFRRSNNFAAQSGVPLHEGRDNSVIQSEDIVADQNLAIAMRTSADADRWDAQPGGHGIRDGVGNGLEYDGDAPAASRESASRSNSSAALSLAAWRRMPPS